MDAREIVLSGIARQAELVRAGEVSARELVEASLSRIAALDPKLNAFRVVLAERALTEADQAQARVGAGDERPLLGVPIAVKDDLDVAGEVTPRGTNAYGDPADQDAEVVRRLRAAGAIVIGKTHLPELAIWGFTESATYGFTRNPWDPDRTTGGSSGGSGAAVAAGMVGAATAGDGAGSIRIPAAYCGLFGLKPQRDRIPLAPQREHWHGLSVYGVLARRVRDTALYLDAVADRDGGDAFVAAAGRPPGRLRIALSLKIPPGIGAVIGRLDEEVRRGVEETAELLRSLGHEVVERDPDYGGVGNNAVVRYLRGIREDVAGMAHPERLERRTRAIARLAGLIPDGVLAREREREAAHAERVGRLFADHDVLLTPVTARPPGPVGENEGKGAVGTLLNQATMATHTPIWNALGQPAAAVPAGLTRSGLPLSAQLVGRPGDEATLLSLAAQLEAGRPWADRLPPVS